MGEALYEENEEVVRGVVHRVTYRNPENGYCVLQVTVSGKADPLTVVGVSAHVAVGTHVIVRGTYATHPKFGRQFSARALTEVMPSTSDGLVNYLSSDLIKGIGQATAEKIVATFGEKTIETIVRDPDAIAKVSGVGKHRAELLHEAIVRREANREVEQFLVEHHVSPRLARKIIDKYQTRSVEVLNRDPYVLARVFRGVGFTTADSIALNIGLRPDSPQRLMAGIAYALEKAADDGHCFLSNEDLQQKARALLDLDTNVSLEEAVDRLVQEGTLVRHVTTLQLEEIDRAEDFTAHFVAARAKPFDEPIVNPLTVERVLHESADSLGVTFSHEQRAAVLNISRAPLSIITGGPGCGKTTIVRAISHLFRESGKRLLLAAPTGRAAQRLAQVCESPASTIHRLLRFDPTTGGFKHGPDDPLICDCVIIDEASMIDIYLARSLFAAIPRRASVVLVGDRDQLPSVGPGRVFGDLIELNVVPTTNLSLLFRRSQGSLITDTAHQINSGIVPDIPQPDGETKTDAYFIPRSDADEAADLVVKLVADQLPKKFGFELKDITVLTPSNRGPLGTAALNKKLQERLNPKGAFDLEQEVTIGDMTLRVNDRVCQRVNNYNIDDIGVFNGDIGRVHAIEHTTKSAWVELWDGRLIKYNFNDLHQLSLAYAITVHRSQGSEIPCVVMVLHDSQYTLLERQLVYTGLTRAKKFLVIVGSKRALAIACKRKRGHDRNTLLRGRVMEIMNGASQLKLD